MTGKLSMSNIMFLSFLNDKLSILYTWDRTDIICDYEHYGFTMEFITETVEDIYSKLNSGIHPDSIAIEYLNSRVVDKEDFHKISFKGVPLFVFDLSKPTAMLVSIGLPLYSDDDRLHLILNTIHYV